MKLIELLVRLVVGGVFVVAGALKILHPTAFVNDIANYRLMPHDLINMLAITLPWVEVVAGGLLIAGIWKRASALLITFLMIVFLVAIGQALYRGLDIRCGCFGTVEARRVSALALAEDAALLGMSLWLFWRVRD
ncbi:MAG TPA: MauE/DoxX family redox-associated membrane protein [Verrucomicrobiae bacterium]|nr:MauE/DoxX family redox-associated membrane protein [Verrucomicrobiae bacterium]